MIEIIKVEHEDDLQEAECPAIYVMGVGHAHKDGKRVTTYSLMINDIFLEKYRALWEKYMRTDVGESDLQACHNQIRHLLIGNQALYDFCSVEQTTGDPNIFVAIHIKQEAAWKNVKVC